MIESPELSQEVSSNKRDSHVRWADNVQRARLMTRRYWWIAALTIMIALGIQDYLRLHDVTQYVSTSRMIMNGRLAIPSNDLYSDEVVNFLGTQAALMQSQATINQAVDRVYTIHPEVVADEAALVGVGIEPRTSIINLRVTSSNSDYAKLLLDAIMDTYLANKHLRIAQTMDDAVSAITEEIAHLDVSIKSDEQKLLDFQKDNNVVFIETQSSNSASQLVGLNNELSKLVKDRDLMALVNKDTLLGPGYNRDANGNATQDAPPPPPSPAPAVVATAPGSTPPVLPGSLPDVTPAPNTAAGTTPATTGASTTNTGTPRNKSFSDADPVLIQQDRIEKLKISRDQLGAFLKDKHPKMMALADQIEQEQKFLDVLNDRSSKRSESMLEEMNLQIQNLQQQIEVANANSLKLGERLGTYEQLKSQISREQGRYNQLSLSIQNVDFSKSQNVDSMVILEAASPARLIIPHYSIHLLYAAAAGLAVGLFLMYLVSRLDDKIDSTLQLEENFDLPIMGQIPHVQSEKKSKRIALLGENDPRHEFLEYHRNLRSAILYQAPEAPKLGSLMICSAAPGEGKSTLAADLSIVFAHSGIRVLLIDADLRRGVLHTLLEQPEVPGLTDYLKGDISWPEIVQTTKIPNLSLIPRGKVFFGAGDLLLSGAVDAIVQEAVADYDLLLWDSAPLLAAHDAANLCTKMDGILFVARVRKSSIGSVRSALEDLTQRNARVLGFVLNAVDYKQPGYLKKYRYKEYYETTVSS